MSPDATPTLAKRVKELDCLYAISSLVEQEDSLEAILRGIVELLPRALQYPQNACARIVLEGRTFRTGNFEETSWKLSQEIVSHGEPTGTMEVFYLEEVPRSDRGPFLKEDRVLLAAAAERLGRTVEQLRAEEALREKVRLSQILLDGFPCVALLLRPGTREIVASNQAAVRVGAVAGKTCFGTWAQSDKPCPWCLAPVLWSTGEPQHLEPHGLGRVWDAHWIPVSEDMFLHYAFDITDRKRAEAEREELIAKLESQNAELERFAYTVSHDLRTPLITIKGYLGILKEDMAEGNAERVEDDFTRIAGAADTMSQLLQDILELSRIGRSVNPPEDVALADLAGEAVSLISTRIAEGNVRIEIAPDLPVIYGDHLRLREVLQNLLENAVKYMGDQPQPRIEIGSRRRGNETVCFVRDNGMGIEPRYHERIFGLFDQLDQQVEGTGIGLALAKRIVEVHGGRIWVESEGPGRGSTFCFTIPGPKSSDGRAVYFALMS